MPRISFSILVLVIVSACSPRGEIQYGLPVPNGTVQNVWVANFRSTVPLAEGQNVPPRPEKMSFEMNAVSVPPTHQTGNVEWPRRSAPDATTDFVTLSTQEFPNIRRFAAAVAASDTENTNGTVLFVHGYNNTHGEAVYNLAQVGFDFDIPSPTVLFSWPSAATAAGYVYDRDSALYARDQLEEVIIALTGNSDRKLVIMAHSVGSLIVMETLRQIEISGSVNIADKIDALFLISPDIDGELFYTQAARLKNLPNPTVVVAAAQDRALRLSAILTRTNNRLGSLTDRSAVRDLPITVVDVSELATGGLNHSIALSSPAAIAIIRSLSGDTLLSGARLTPLLVLGSLG